MSYLLSKIQIRNKLSYTLEYAHSKYVQQQKFEKKIQKNSKKNKKSKAWEKKTNVSAMARQMGQFQITYILQK